MVFWLFLLRLLVSFGLGECRAFYQDSFTLQLSFAYLACMEMYKVNRVPWYSYSSKRLQILNQSCIPGIIHGINTVAHGVLSFL